MDETVERINVTLLAAFSNALMTVPAQREKTVAASSPIWR